MRIPDDKYTKFQNETLEALCRMKLSGAHITVFLYVLRNTVGRQRERSSISIKKMAEDTGYSRRWLIGMVDDLEKMGMLRVSDRKPGRTAVFELLEPDCWDQPVNSTSHVNETSQGCELYFTGGVNITSQVGVNNTSQVPVNSTSHIKEKRKKKDLKKGDRLPDGDDTEPKETGLARIAAEADEDGWEDPEITARRWGMN